MEEGDGTVDGSENGGDGRKKMNERWVTSGL
jgi:hypothetical protein